MVDPVLYEPDIFTNCTRWLAIVGEIIHEIHFQYNCCLLSLVSVYQVWP